MGSRINMYSVKLIKESGKVYDTNGVIKSPVDAYHAIEAVHNLSERTQEHFGILMLNVKNRIIGTQIIHTGTLNSSVVHPRDVLQPAILANSGAIMVFHNHPSGDPAPSNEDVEVTKRLQEACDIIGIDMLDHIITGDPDAVDENKRFLSLKEHSFIF